MAQILSDHIETFPVVEHWDYVRNQWVTKEYSLMRLVALPGPWPLHDLQEVVGAEVVEWVYASGPGQPAHQNVLARFTTEDEARAWWADNKGSYIEDEYGNDVADTDDIERAQLGGSQVGF